MNWTALDTWIVVVGALAAVACALPGTFLVLRGMSMMADAIAHSVLPGIVVAFLLGGGFAPAPMLAGAIVLGVLAALAVQWIHDRSGLDSGAAIGVVFTGLFAVGLLLIRTVADHVELDLDCVLFGSLETTPLTRIRALPLAPPRAAVVLAVVCVAHALVIALFFKELQLATFDPEQAEAQGLRPRRLHLLVSAMTAASTVAAFEAVGSVLVLSMVVTPAAIACLLAQRLRAVLFLALGLGVGMVFLGHVAAISLPHRLLTGVAPEVFGRVRDASTAGTIAALAGACFALTVVAVGRRQFSERS